MDGVFCFAGISPPEQPQKVYLFDHKHDKNLLFWKLHTVTITVKTGFSDKELIQQVSCSIFAF